MSDLFENIRQLGGSKRFEQLLELLAHNTVVSDVFLWGFGLQASHCHAVKKLLHTTRFISLCVLAGNDLGDDGVELVCEGLLNNTTVSLLGLLNTGFALRGCLALAHLFRNNKTIRLAGLSHNGYGDEGAMILFCGMVDGGCLHRVELEACGISTRGLDALLEVMEYSPSFTQVVLRNNPGFDADESLPKMGNIAVRNVWNSSRRRASLLQIMRWKVFGSYSDEEVQRMVPKPLPPLPPLLSWGDANISVGQWFHDYGYPLASHYYAQGQSHGLDLDMQHIQLSVYLPPQKT